MSKFSSIRRVWRAAAAAAAAVAVFSGAAVIAPHLGGHGSAGQVALAANPDGGGSPPADGSGSGSPAPDAGSPAPDAGSPGSNNPSQPDPETAARNDLLSRLSGDIGSGIFITGMVDDENPPETMDTAKVIQTGPGAYLAVYTGNGKFDVKLATSANLRVWHYVTTLDPSASQPDIAQAGNGSFVLADEQQDSPGSQTSHLHFMHYPKVQALQNAQPDKTLNPMPHFGGNKFFSSCNEGTPDIHGLSFDGLSFGFGFHYHSACWPFAGPDRQAFGAVTNFGSPTATQDTVRDNAVTAVNNGIDAAGFPGAHGGRDDITWHGWRFSIQEAQMNNSLDAFDNWRYVLYDYSNHQAYLVKLTPAITATCYGNPRITLLNDPNGNPIILLTGFIFGGTPPAGCTHTQGGEFLYTMPQQ
jgi:hypothetical protein